MLNKRKFYINGEWVNHYKENDCEVINPCNEEPFATISLGSKEDTNLAVKSAKTAFEKWKETTKEERIDDESIFNSFPRSPLAQLAHGRLGEPQIVDEIVQRRRHSHFVRRRIGVPQMVRAQLTNRLLASSAGGF